MFKHFKRVLEWNNVINILRETPDRKRERREVTFLNSLWFYKLFFENSNLKCTSFVCLLPKYVN